MRNHTLQEEDWKDDEKDYKLLHGGCTVVTYSPSTLIGNWFEERFDIRRPAQRRPLPSQYSHYYETTYSLAYNREEKHPLVASSLNSQGRCFPGHHPELDPPYGKYEPVSTYRQDFQGNQQNMQGNQKADQSDPGPRSSSK